MNTQTTNAMDGLRNKLHEDFARAIAEGQSPTEAYRKLSPSAKNPNTLGSRLWNRKEVRHRVAEIANEAREHSHLTIVQKRSILQQQILGDAPTKVIVKPSGTELVYDTLGAIMLDSRMAGHLDGSEDQQTDKLKLTFTIGGRDSDPSTWGIPLLPESTSTADPEPWLKSDKHKADGGLDS